MYLKYSNYVIASFKYPINARVHTKYSEVSPPRLSNMTTIRVKLHSLHCDSDPSKLIGLMEVGATRRPSL
jgi:hypothetical protein